jgi:uncharacterized protein
MLRRSFIQQGSLASVSLLIAKNSFRSSPDFPVVRIAESQRKFKSPAVEKAILEIKKNLSNQELGWLFENCFPNTLDSTVDFEIINGKPDTYVITGDIDAMWLRDSSAQVWPYLPFMKEDGNLRQLIEGVIRRQTKCILIDPYANAFYKDQNKVSPWKSTDNTEMKPGIHERKWEIDSLCYPVRLAYGYWKETGDTSAFDKDWVQAMKLVLKTFKEQQRKEGQGPYTFQRKTDWATDGVPLGGYGYPTRKNGLIHSMFRPSDDATIFPFLIPSNCFAIVTLGYLTEMWKDIFRGDEFYKEFQNLSAELKEGVSSQGTVNHPQYGKIYAYETNGFGSYNLMDDANVPSLLALPYLRFSTIDDTVYKNTRAFVLSAENPFFFAGKAGEGIGGPHAGMDMIWPLSIVMRGLTSDNDLEIKKCLKMLQNCQAGTGFMHESFHKDDASNFTRKWFAWANTLFGEFVLKVYQEKSYLFS